MAQNDWITWAIGGLIAAILGYTYLTGQKADGKQEIAVGEPNPSTPKKAGCGCGL